MGPGVEEYLKKGQLEKIPPEVLQDIIEAQASGRTLVSGATGRAFTIEGEPFYRKAEVLLSTPRPTRRARTELALQVGPEVGRLLREEEYAKLPQQVLEDIVEAQYYGRPVVVAYPVFADLEAPKVLAEEKPAVTLEG